MRIICTYCLGILANPERFTKGDLHAVWLEEIHPNP